MFAHIRQAGTHKAAHRGGLAHKRESKLINFSENFWWLGSEKPFFPMMTQKIREVNEKSSKKAVG